MSSPNLFFPTPVWVSQLEKYREVNDSIFSYIKNMQNEDNKGLTKSNIKGWHSKDFNLKDNKVIDFIKHLSPHINKALLDMDWDIKNQIVKISSMWAIINIGGASNARHHHGNSTISAAYYVKAPINCGEIVFYDPRPAPVYSHPRANKPNSFNAMINSINPVEGGLVLFPSYLDHSVNPNLSDEERIVVSFNINLIIK
ncbi:TIGR02466 family protein [Pelagibacteraceae bacterium]|nr:TIGR02466 family protein [Pelagibacteraceae bacterium]